MDSIAKTPCILLLENIFVRDFTQQKTSALTPTTQSMAWTVHPRKFTSVDKWIKSTNLKCMECSENFTSYPKFIPLNPRIINGEVEYEARGNFCKWCCMIKHVRKEYPASQLWDIENNARDVYFKFTGKKILKIPSAYDKSIMEQYCGTGGVTSKVFHEMNEALEQTMIGDNQSVTGYI